LKFDLTGAATTAGIQNTTLNNIDITKYTNDGSVFVWAYINSTTNLTNFILQIGNDLTANYYSQTITTTNEGVAFSNGWNLLRFDFASMTQTGTVAPTTVDSIRLYMTKTLGKSDDGYRFDNITLHTGEYHDILYYSKYGWQTSSGTFLENSTASTDKLNCDTEEFDLFVYKGKELASADMKDWNGVKYYEGKYLERKKQYQKTYKSERMPLETNYYTF
jgi:hypothetical protein